GVDASDGGFGVARHPHAVRADEDARRVRADADRRADDGRARAVDPVDGRVVAVRDPDELLAEAHGLRAVAGLDLGSREELAGGVVARRDAPAGDAAPPDALAGEDALRRRARGGDRGLPVRLRIDRGDRAVVEVRHEHAALAGGDAVRAPADLD